MTLSSLVVHFLSRPDELSLTGATIPQPRLPSESSSSCPELEGSQIIPKDKCIALTAEFTSRQNALRSTVKPEYKYPLSARREFAEGTSTALKKISVGSRLLTQDAPMTAFLGYIQHQASVFGSAGEIGVHHGLFTIPIAHTLLVGENLFAADLFDSMQHLNVEKSGKGNLEAFLRNLANFGIPKSDVELFIGPSYNIPNDYSLKHQPIRMVSIDGGHTAAIAQSDIEWAACNLVEGGIIIVDDFWHQGWPGVTEAVYREFSCGPRKLFPFLAFDGKCKLYLTNTATHHKLYHDAILSHSLWSQFIIPDPSESNMRYNMNDVPLLLMRLCITDKCEQSKLDSLKQEHLDIVSK